MYKVGQKFTVVSMQNRIYSYIIFHMNNYKPTSVLPCIYSSVHFVWVNILAKWSKT